MDVALAGTKGPVPDDLEVPLGTADVKREGSDVTVVAMGFAVGESLTAADRLAAEGISVEVVDPRSLVPLDIDAIVSSVAKTRRLVIADPGRRSCGFAAEVLSQVVERAWESLAAAPVRVTWPDIPVPYSPSLELACQVDADDVIAGIHQVMKTAERVSV